MAQNKTVHTKHMGDNRYRDLSVYYEKGCMNYWDYSQKPKGIYFSSSVYTKSSSGAGFETRTYSITPGQKGEGYILALPLERYKPTALKAVRQRVEDNAVLIHTLLDAGEVSAVVSLVTGSLSQEAIRGLEHACAPIGLQDQAAA